MKKGEAGTGVRNYDGSLSGTKKINGIKFLFRLLYLDLQTNIPASKLVKAN